MRRFITIAVLLLVLILAGYVYWYYFNSKGDGTREGIVQKFSRRGNMFKTWEGEMIQQGFGARGGSLNAHYFYFSVEDENIADSLEHGALGKLVRVHYVQYRRAIPWRGENYGDKNSEPGQYMVDRIEAVTNPEF
jgi:hypothetical protein